MGLGKVIKNSAGCRIFLEVELKSSCSAFLRLKVSSAEWSPHVGPGIWIPESGKFLLV